MGRKGWRESIEPGIARAHRVSCRSTSDHRPGRRCGCPYEVKVPGARPGTVTARTVHGALTDARRVRRAAQSAGRVQAIERADAGTLDDLAVAYLRTNAPRLSPNTVRNRDDDYRLRIAPELGHLDLIDVNRERIEVWLAGLVERASSRRMVVQTVATLRVMLAAGVDWGRLPDNPAAGLPLPPQQTDLDGTVEKSLDYDQLARLFAAAGTTRTEAMFRAAGEAGLRRSEVAGLKWSDVDLDARRLHVRRQIITIRREQDRPMHRIEAPTKGRERRRAAISRTMAALLTRWRNESAGQADGYVWPGKDGQSMHDRSFARAIERACHRADLTDANGKHLVCPHILRHTAGSVMLARGVPLIVVSRQLGHADVNITARVYAHLLSDDQLDAAGDAFDPPEPTGTGEQAGERTGAAD